MCCSPPAFLHLTKSAVLGIRSPFPWHWHMHDFLWLSSRSQDFYMLFTLKLVSFQLACLSPLKGPPYTTPRCSTSVTVEGGRRGEGSVRRGRCDTYLNGYLRKPFTGCLGLFSSCFSFLAYSLLVKPSQQRCIEPACS